MGKAFRVFWAAIKDTYDEMFLLAQLNFVTVLLVLPVVTAPPALAALWAVGNRVSKGEATGWRDYFAAFRQYFGRSWIVAGLNILVLLIIGSNLWFYSPGNNPLNISPQISMWLQALWMAVLTFWLLLAQYLFPLILEQTDQRIQVTLRNAFVLMMGQPWFSIVQLILTVLVVALSILLPILLLLVALGFLAVLGSESVNWLLEPHRERIREGKE
jgi:uncharacterized membrane protein YesL